MNKMIRAVKWSVLVFCERIKKNIVDEWPVEML